MRLISIRSVKSSVAGYFNVDISQLQVDTRGRSVEQVLPKRMAIFFCCQLFDVTYEDIATHFNSTRDIVVRQCQHAEEEHKDEQIAKIYEECYKHIIKRGGGEEEIKYLHELNKLIKNKEV